VENAQSGVALNQQVLGNLHDIDAEVAKVAEVMREIATASQQQSRGVEQITQGVDQLEVVTQQTAANAEEASSAAEVADASRSGPAAGSNGHRDRTAASCAAGRARLRG